MWGPEERVADHVLSLSGFGHSGLGKKPQCSEIPRLPRRAPQTPPYRPTSRSDKLISDHPHLYCLSLCWFSLQGHFLQEASPTPQIRSGVPAVCSSGTVTFPYHLRLVTLYHDSCRINPSSHTLHSVKERRPRPHCSPSSESIHCVRKDPKTSVQQPLYMHFPAPI